MGRSTSLANFGEKGQHTAPPATVLLPTLRVRVRCVMIYLHSQYCMSLALVQSAFKLHKVKRLSQCPSVAF